MGYRLAPSRRRPPCGYGYTDDDAGNRTSKDNLDNSDFDEAYTFDALDRLKTSTRSAVNLQSWNLDPLGNWASTTRGTAAAETRDHNAANEITGIAATSPIAYDAAGNTIADADQMYTYDAWNRLVKVIDATTAATVATYEYDGRNFRIERVIGSDTFDDYYNDAWQLLETQKNGVLSEQYVYDLRYIDSVILRDRDTTANGVLDERLYYTQDAQFNVTGLVDTSGTVVERYAYTPYGERTVFTASWTGLAATAYNNTVHYTGQRLDAETGLHHFRNRFYSADLGRFITRDPLGYVDGMSLYGGYFSHILSTDPTGRQVDWERFGPPRVVLLPDIIQNSYGAFHLRFDMMGGEAGVDSFMSINVDIMERRKSRAEVEADFRRLTPLAQKMQQAIRDAQISAAKHEARAKEFEQWAEGARWLGPTAGFMALNMGAAAWFAGVVPPVAGAMVVVVGIHAGVALVAEVGGDILVRKANDAWDDQRFAEQQVNAAQNNLQNLNQQQKFLTKTAVVDKMESDWTRWRKIGEKPVFSRPVPVCFRLIFK